MGWMRNRAVLTKVRATNAEQMCTNCIISARAKSVGQFLLWSLELWGYYVTRQSILSSADKSTFKRNCNLTQFQNWKSLYCNYFLMFCLFLISSFVSIQCEDSNKV